MLDKNQNQEAGDHSTNIQAQNVTINTGLSIADAKAIAFQVFKDNFIILAGDAYEEAKKRMEDFTDNFLNRLNEKNPDGLAIMNDPGMQFALFAAQKEYAKTGDSDISDILVDLLVDRSSLPERNLMQIVIDESLSIVAKVTQSQLDALSVIFMMNYTSKWGLINLSQL